MNKQKDPVGKKLISGGVTVVLIVAICLCLFAFVQLHSPVVFLSLVVVVVHSPPLVIQLACAGVVTFNAELNQS